MVRDESPNRVFFTFNPPPLRYKIYRPLPFSGFLVKNYFFILFFWGGGWTVKGNGISFLEENGPAQFIN